MNNNVISNELCHQFVFFELVLHLINIHFLKKWSSKYLKRVFINLITFLFEEARVISLYFGWLDIDLKGKIGQDKKEESTDILNHI